MFSRIFLQIASCLCFIGCIGSCSTPPKKGYAIAADPLWYPLDLMGRENNILGFSTDILKAISSKESIRFSLQNTNWDTLFEGLKQKKYEGVLSSLYPYQFNQSLYNFSEPYLKTGPVLVVAAGSSIASLADMQGKEIGLLSGSSSVLIVETHPSILVHLYASIPAMLNDLIEGSIDAALVPILSAQAYQQDLYKSRIEITTPPLNDEGLRLVTLKGQTALIESFNEGLTKIKKEGSYQALEKKWSL